MSTRIVCPVAARLKEIKQIKEKESAEKLKADRIAKSQDIRKDAKNETLSKRREMGHRKPRAVWLKDMLGNKLYLVDPVSKQYDKVSNLCRFKRDVTKLPLEQRREIAHIIVGSVVQALVDKVSEEDVLEALGPFMPFFVSKSAIVSDTFKKVATDTQKQWQRFTYLLGVFHMGMCMCGNKDIIKTHLQQSAMHGLGFV